jgi:hypothetical protein
MAGFIKRSEATKEGRWGEVEDTLAHRIAKISEDSDAFARCVADAPGRRAREFPVIRKTIEEVGSRSPETAKEDAAPDITINPDTTINQEHNPDEPAGRLARVASTRAAVRHQAPFGARDCRRHKGFNLSHHKKKTPQEAREGSQRYDLLLGRDT